MRIGHVAAVLVPFVALGCGDARQRPRAGAGDPAVFTTLHMAAAQESAATALAGSTTQPVTTTVGDDMLRYFRLSAAEYAKVKLRSDDMLESRQAADSVAQLASSALEISAKVTWLKMGMNPPAIKPAATGQPAAPADATAATAKADAAKADAAKAEPTKEGGSKDGTPKKEAAKGGEKGDEAEEASPGPTTVPTLTNADKQALGKALAELVQDSAFDQIDRVYDFYTSLHLKTLMMFGRDSRAHDPEQLWSVVEKSRRLRELHMLEGRRLALQEKSARLQKLAGNQEQLKKRLAEVQKGIAAARDGINETRRKTGGGLAVRDHALTSGHDLPESSDAKAIEQEIEKVEEEHRELQAEVKALRDDVANAETAPPPTQPAIPAGVSRLIYLVFPVSVSPGTKANQMCGVRIRIVDSVGPDGCRTGAGLVKVVSLHPQRTYDLQSELSIDLSRELLNLALAAQVGTDSPDRPSGDGSLKKRSELQSERRRNFLSRMSKQGAFVDSPNHEFGWNFYPTNLQVNDVSAGKKFLNWLFGAPKNYYINAYLDGGAYNCAAYVVVPWDLKSFDYQVDYVYAEVDQDGNGGPEHRVYLDKSGQPKPARGSGNGNTNGRSPVTVDLPPASVRELQAAYKATVK